MPVVVVKVAGTDITSDVLFSTARFRSLVNGKPGEASMRVRDNTSAYSFTEGADWLLTVDGNAVWRGFVTQISRVYVAPAMNVADSGLQRFWDLTGVDLNILLANRVVFNLANPVQGDGTQFPANTADTVAITDLVTNWLDLSTDDLDVTSGVTGVGALDPAEVSRPWSSAQSWSDAMTSIAMLPAAIFYIRPEVGSPKGTLVYCDVDSPTSPFGLSDVPDGVTTKGFREMEIVLDGTSLANDVLEWGFGYGSQTPVFKRITDATSVAAHGTWQTAGATTGIYKQATIDRVADSIINGSPEHHRGTKDDYPSVTLTTYHPGLLAGHVVPFTSNIWSYTETLPVRQLEVSFESPTDPRYELTLSHSVDSPWSFVDQFWPGAGGIGLPPQIVPPGNIPQPSGGSACDCGITDSFTRTIGPTFYPSTDGWGVADCQLPWIITLGVGSDDGTTSAWVDGTAAHLLLKGQGSHTADAALGNTESGGLSGEVLIKQTSTHYTATSEIYTGFDGATVFLNMGTGPDNADPRYRGNFIQVTNDNVTFDKAAFTWGTGWNHVKWEVDATHISAKVWPDGSAEPVGWMVTVTTAINLTPVGWDYLMLFATDGNVPGGGGYSYADWETMLDSLNLTGVDRCTAVQFDNFNRTVASGWGVATPSGYTWLPGTITGSWLVNGATGVLWANSGFFKIVNVYTNTDPSAPWMTLTGWTLDTLFTFEATNLIAWMTIGVEIPSGASMWVRLDANNSLFCDQEALGGGPAPGWVPFTYVADVTYHLKWFLDWGGSDTSGASKTWKAKVWVEGAAEPDWMITGSGGSAYPTSPMRLFTNTDGFSNTSSVQGRYEYIDFGYTGKPCYLDCGTLTMFDDFTRTVVNDWGTASPSGSVWGTGTVRGSRSVNGSAGLIVLADGGSGAEVWGYVSPYPTFSDIPWTMVVRFNRTAGSGSYTDDERFFWGFGDQAVGTPWVSYDPPYFCKLFFSKFGGSPTITIGDTGGSSFSAAISRVNGWYTLVVEMSPNPSGSGIFRAKCWDDSVSDPGWQVTYAGFDGFDFPSNAHGKGLSFDANQFVSQPDVTYAVDSIQFTTCQPVGPVSTGSSVPIGPNGYGCVNATRVSSTIYSVPTAFIAGATAVWRDGLFQRNGTDYTENGDHLGITFSDAVATTSTIRVCYFVAAAL